SCRMIIVILAILKSGGAYLPISPGLPPARKRFMLLDSAIKLLIIQRHLSDTNKALLDLLPPGDILYLEEKKKSFAVEETAAAEIDPGALPVKVTPRGPGYVIYTSGSTGRPKGVVVEHRGIVNYICWAAGRYVKEEKVTFPLFTSFSFDLTVTSIFTPLLTGNTIVIYQGDEKEFLSKKVIAENRVNFVKLTPSHLKLILEIMAGSSPFLPAGEKSNIKRFVLGGENLPAQLAGEIYEKFNRDIEIYNEYGPTETVVGSMIHQYDPAAGKQGAVPIGVPIANTYIYLLDQGKKPVPLGTAGELFISGAGVGRGYLNQPGLTAEKFLANPFLPAERMYASGD
ncbi:MAG: AMP-binding protein, partial [bacterium]|nr:AMP-binding protein [bacterium]